MEKSLEKLINAAKKNKEIHFTVLKMFGGVFLFVVLMCVLISTFPKATALSMLVLLIFLIFGLLYAAIFDSVKIHKRIKG